MLPLTRKSLNLTLVLTITLALVLTASADIDAHHRRDHLQLNRLIRKRQGLGVAALVDTPSNGRSNFAANNAKGPDVIPGGVVGVEADPTASTTPAVSKSAVAASVSDTAPTSKVVAGGAGATAATPTPAANPTSASRSVSVSVSSSAQSSSSSSTSTSATTSATSETLNLTAAPSITTPASIARVTVTSTSGSAALPSSSASDSTGAPSTKRTTFTVLIVIVASVGGAAIIWTIIRKWKFKPSSQFEDRMQPIDWQPTGAEDGGIPGHRRRTSGASSFHSGTGHGEAAPHAGAGAYGVAADYSHGEYPGAPSQPPLNPLPDHDFTAGAARAGLAPVGGYADLARGPSPQPPQMQDMSQGPMYHPQYEQYAGGVPLHHQTGYATQDAYDYNGTAAPRY